MPDANPNPTTRPNPTQRMRPTREAVQRLLAAAAGDAPEWSPTGLARGWTAAVAAYAEDDDAGDGGLRANELSDAQITRLHMLGEAGSRHAGDIAAKLAVVVLETAMDGRGGGIGGAIHRITSSALADVVLLGDRALPTFASVTAASVAPEPPAQSEGAARHPDAALLAACAAFDTLERHYIAAFGGKELTRAKEEARDEALEPIQDAQKPLVDIIASTPAKTLEGIRAKAKSLALWDDGVSEDGDGPDGCTDVRLRASLMRDLLRGTDPQPDAELIRIGDVYMRAFRAYNATAADMSEAADKAALTEVEALEVRLGGLTARTIEGCIAEARIAACVAEQPGRSEFTEGHAADWAERAVTSLLRVSGEPAAELASPRGAVQAAPLAALARKIATVQRQHANFDDMAMAAGAGDRDAAGDAVQACAEQEIALRQMILCGRAAGLADATAQIHTALMQVAIARECEGTEEMLADVMRGLRSALGVLTQSIGVDIADFGEMPREPKVGQ